jgi:hypothetical protein
MKPLSNEAIELLKHALLYIEQANTLSLKRRTDFATALRSLIEIGRIKS